VTTAREILRAIENYINILQVFPEGFFGFTEVVLAVVLILILIYRPTGFMGSREIGWPLYSRKRKAASDLNQLSGEDQGASHV
jgi:ABC-type branched-subunit amino acid transport system permease subunit